MDKISEIGIAAHWQYKEGHLRLSPEEVIQIAKIRELFDAAQDAENASEFMEAVKTEFYADEVFVFTPKGDVKRFPLGATTIDFAYAVHTDVGNHCTGAKANGRMVPLRYALQSGDSIEILTSDSQRPSRDWIAIARTGRAIQKIRRYLRQEEQEQGIRLGRDMLEGELKKYHWNLQRVTREGLLKDTLRARGFKDLDLMLVEVGKGTLMVAELARQLLPPEVTAVKEEQQNALSTFINRFRRPTASPVIITGEHGLLVNFAKCCQPLPGEPVTGFITRGRGITVHRLSCTQLDAMDATRQIAVEWDQSTETRHTAEIRIVCTDRPGMLANITKSCEQVGVNINSAEARAVYADSPAVVTLNLQIRDVAELTRLIGAIERLPGVETVTRTVG